MTEINWMNITEKMTGVKRAEYRIWWGRRHIITTTNSIASDKPTLIKLLKTISKAIISYKKKVPTLAA